LTGGEGRVSEGEHSEGKGAEAGRTGGGAGRGWRKWAAEGSRELGISRLSGSGGLISTRALRALQAELAIP